MNQPLHVATVVGTRPEIIRLSRVLARLDESEAFRHTLIHTGQNFDYELNEIFFKDLGLRKPDFFLDAAGQTAFQTIGQVIAKVGDVLMEIKPDAVLILGDTNSCLAAIPAKKLQIPVFHMEAGNRCFDQRVPEEINRRIVDHVSDINLTYSTIARDYLLSEGLPFDRVIKTGSPMFEVLHHHLESIRNSDVLDRLGLEPGKYFLVSMHRAENVDSDERFSKAVGMLNDVAETYKMPVLMSTHPRTASRIKSTGLELHPLIQTHKPLGFFDYVHLQTKARVVLSDSGTISEESSILKFPALNIREAHERPEAMEQAAVMMVGFNIERIHQGIRLLEEASAKTGRQVRNVDDYSMPDVADKVLRILISYTDYVNQVVWKKR